jgi:hypothetical protein
MSKTYSGKSTGAGGQSIIITDEFGHWVYLRHICRHSPDGFNWGYGGSGPSDAALSIMADAVGLEEAEKWYQRFKAAFVAKWGAEFSITEEEVVSWLQAEKARSALSI